LHPFYWTGIHRTIQDVGGHNRSAKPWKNSRSAFSPQRSSHIALVSPLSHQRSGGTTLPTGQPRKPSTRLANRPYRSDTTGFISALCPQSRGRWTLRPLLGRNGGQACKRSSPRLDRTIASGRLAPTEWRSLSEPAIPVSPQAAGPAVPETEIGAGGVPGCSGMPGAWKSQPVPGKARGFRGQDTVERHDGLGVVMEKIDQWASAMACRSPAAGVSTARVSRIPRAGERAG